MTTSHTPLIIEVRANEFADRAQTRRFLYVRDGDGLEMAALAILRGGHVSIGLGDDPYLRLGLPTDSDLVRRVAHLAETVGRPVATQARARAITGLHRTSLPSWG